jgi:methylthioribose-1-phosphate isomerase
VPTPFQASPVEGEPVVALAAAAAAAAAAPPRTRYKRAKTLSSTRPSGANWLSAIKSLNDLWKEKKRTAKKKSIVLIISQSPFSHRGAINEREKKETEKFFLLYFFIF